ncbi:alpha-(1,6)-fucosyltransferase-like [Diadema antillarum]|uniref:alpha-(1,6)-fucosyltransferase-like n=1 Tax=Diadema antillarum TaxID=105358 RepID=UPI003A85A9DE
MVMKNMIVLVLGLAALVYLPLLLVMRSCSFDRAQEARPAFRLHNYIRQESSRHQEESLVVLQMPQDNFTDHKADTERESLVQTDKISEVSSKLPSLAYEKARRRVGREAEELGSYLDRQLTRLKNATRDTATRRRLEEILIDLGERQRSLINDIQNLSQVDGYKANRRKEIDSLAALVQSRLRYIQNPHNCSTARKIVCRLRDEVGYGCHLHHIAGCLIAAYATNRTLIVNTKRWNYAPNGWSKIFLPLSETCTSGRGRTRADWDDFVTLGKDAQVIYMPTLLRIKTKTPLFIPPAVPADLAGPLARLHGFPAVWWVGQIMLYIQRLKPHQQEMLTHQAYNMGFKHPIVGVHVRRTDKLLKEASFHPIEQYMDHVEEFFLRLEMTAAETPVRRVYLATDDRGLLAEARAKFPNYIFVSSSAITNSARLESRYTEESLWGIVQDLMFLARTDFLVCTLSSQIGRAAYEMMQAYHTDASTLVRSLDDKYFFAGGRGYDWVVRRAHRPRSAAELDLQPGDVVRMIGNHWDGYSMGSRRRVPHEARVKGLFPTYKVEDSTLTAQMPTYPELQQTP